MKLLKVLSILVCLGALGAGCASGPRYTNVRPGMTAPPEGYGRVWFYRPAVFGAPVQPEVKLDGQVVGRAVPRGVFYVDTPAGTHEISAATEWKHTATVTVAPNADTYVKLKVFPGLLVRHIVPQQVSEARATEELASMRVMD